jgi:hypothetical protein
MQKCCGHILVWSVALGFLAGCGGGEESAHETVVVTGTVTVNNSPVEGAIVSFHPEKGRVATGKTDSEGKYTLQTFKANDGATLGKHKVTISHNAASSTPSNDPMAIKKAAKAKSPINKKYATVKTSDLNAEVTKDGENDFKFDLK